MRLSVDQAHTRLGRGPGVDLAFADAALSRTHAVIACDADVLTLRPAGPDVGAIRINGAPLAGVRHVLCDGDILELGAQRFAVSIQARDTSGGAPYQR
jgi:pSer/pThr/pTyr-binding forkhead associated (FHA) protein